MRLGLHHRPRPWRTYPRTVRRRLGPPFRRWGWRRRSLVRSSPSSPASPASASCSACRGASPCRWRPRLCSSSWPAAPTSELSGPRFSSAFSSWRSSSSPGARTPAWRRSRGTQSTCPSVNSGFLLPGRGHHRGDLQPMDALLPAVPTVDKRLQPGELVHARWDTTVGAILTQCLTGAVLVAAASALRRAVEARACRERGRDQRRSHAGPRRDRRAGGVRGRRVRRLAGRGDRSSLALAWGVGEVAGYRCLLEYRPFEAGWFYGVYAACVIGSCAVVWFASNLVWLNIAAQVLNAFLMPLDRRPGGAGGQSAAGAASPQRLVSRTDRCGLRAGVGGRPVRGLQAVM